MVLSLEYSCWPYPSFLRQLSQQCVWRGLLYVMPILMNKMFDQINSPCYFTALPTDTHSNRQSASHDEQRVFS